MLYFSKTHLCVATFIVAWELYVRDGTADGLERYGLMLI